MTSEEKTSNSNVCPVNLNQSIQYTCFPFCSPLKIEHCPSMFQHESVQGKSFKNRTNSTFPWIQQWICITCSPSKLKAQRDDDPNETLGMRVWIGFKTALTWKAQVGLFSGLKKNALDDKNYFKRFVREYQKMLKHFYTSNLHCIWSVHAFPGNQTHDLGVASTMLYCLTTGRS